MTSAYTRLRAVEVIRASSVVGVCRYSLKAEPTRFANVSLGPEGKRGIRNDWKIYFKNGVVRNQNG